MSIPLRVTFLGTGAVHPTARRGTTSVLVVLGGDKWLFDCGEGTQAKLWAATGGLPDLDGVFLTHYHADHVLGLIGMIETMALWGRSRPLSIYGPQDPAQMLQRHTALMSRGARDLIRWIPVQTDALACKCDDYQIDVFPVLHARRRAVGYKLREYTKPGHIDAVLCEGAGLTGPEIGRVKRGETVKGVRPQDVMGPDRIGRSIAITGDTSPSAQVVKAARGVDLLVHEATYLHGQRDHIEHEHTTALEAGQIGGEACVRRLALTHIAARNTNKAVFEEASKTYAGELIVPRDLQFIDL